MGRWSLYALAADGFAPALNGALQAARDMQTNNFATAFFFGPPSKP